MPRPTIVKPPPEDALALQTRIVYRDRRGRFAVKGTRGARRYVYQYQVDTRTGQVIRMLSMVGPGVTVKSGTVDVRGEQRGRLDWALVKSSATALYPRAKMIEVTVKGVDRRGKERRIKLTFDLESVRRKGQIHQAVIGRILDAMRANGFRTSYAIELFKVSASKGLAHEIGREEWSQLEPLQNVEIITTIYK